MRQPLQRIHSIAGAITRRGILKMILLRSVAEALQFETMDRKPVFDEKSLEKRHVGERQFSRIRVTTMEVVRAFQDFPIPADLVERVFHCRKIFPMIGLDVKRAARLDEARDLLELTRREESVLRLRRLGPGIGEEKIEMVDFARAEHELDSLRVRPEKQEIADISRDSLFGGAADRFELPVDADICVSGRAEGPFADDMSRVTADFDMKRAFW